MSQPYCTTSQVINRVLSALAAQAAWNLTDPGQAAVQDITYTVLAGGAPSPVTVAYLPGGVAGAEIVAVVGQAISVQIQSGVSTAAQVLAAVVASTSAAALVSAAITGVGTNPQIATTSPVIITGDVAQRIAEGDRKIDSKLAGLEVALPFAPGANPPVLTDLSVLYARYACFRDLFAAGDPSVGLHPQADHYLTEFEKAFMDLEEGWVKLVSAGGVQTAMTKFTTVAANYPLPATRGVDEYPNYPSGPYPDPPGIEY
jgi:hypothetical protein